MARLIALVVLAQCLCATCNLSINLVSSTKRATESSTVSSNDFSTGQVVEKSRVVFNGSNLYLEDVLYALRSQAWAEEEVPCLNRTLMLLRSLQNFTLWSVWEWESISSKPVGFLYGTQYHLGNYDECLNTPWRSSHPELRSKYCLADITLQRTDHNQSSQWDKNDPYQSYLKLIGTKSPADREIKTLTWGMCVPVECQPRSVEKLTKVMLAHTHLNMAGLREQISVNDTCQELYINEIPYDGLFYSFVGLMVFLIITAITCTILNNKSNKYKGVGSGVIRAFDIRSNMAAMMQSSDGPQVLYGVRVLSCIAVVVGHQIVCYIVGPVSNAVDIDVAISSYLGYILLHDDLLVDSFYMLSGFLTAACITKRLPNPLIMIFKRWSRLIVPYAVVIFYVVAVYPYTGSGPLWGRTILTETAHCKQNWWLNLLMVSNYVDPEHTCIVVSWYIPSDFHFFVVSLLLYALYRRCPTLGKVLAATVTILSMVLPGLSTYMNNYPPIHAFTLDFLLNPRTTKQFNDLYIKSHMRYSAYIVGFMAGYIYVRPSLIINFKRFSQARLTTIAYISTVSMFACMYLSDILYFNDCGAIVNSLYAALNRPVWALGLAVLVLCCSVGHVPYIKAFLSWYPWVPISRLSYGVYLSHFVFIFHDIYITRNLLHYDFFQLMTMFAGITVWSHIAALVIWVFADAPINNLVSLMLKQGMKRNKTIDVEEETQIHENRAYQEDNLPCAIISSKI